MCVREGGVEGIHFPEADVIMQQEPDELAIVQNEESCEAMVAREALCIYFARSKRA